MSDYPKGTPIMYWPGWLGGFGRRGMVISDGVVKFGGTDCVRIEKADGGTDYIALTHVEKIAHED